jgi:hypothetical protein
VDSSSAKLGEEKFPPSLGSFFAGKINDKNLTSSFSMRNMFNVGDGFVSRPWL